MLVSMILWGLFFDWGFYAHKIINQHAVFSLPIELVPFYKSHISYISTHSIDPDKRRYIVPGEAKKHFIDLDHWGDPPFSVLSRDYTKDLQNLLILQRKEGDTLVNLRDRVQPHVYDSIFFNYALPVFLKEDTEFLLEGKLVTIIDSFTHHGILPYHLEKMLENLTQAFKDLETEKILRLSSEFGHYIGDAAVPLHTTKNYNGQLTGQDGIHALWETKIPELLLEKEFDLWAEKAEYIRNPREFYWNLVLDSHDLVGSVLANEKEAKSSLQGKFHYCWQNRNQSMVKTECPELVKKYNDLLNNQVEMRLKAAIHAIASSWFTAWIDAGKPTLKQLKIDFKTSNDPDSEIEELFLCIRPQ